MAVPDTLNARIAIAKGWMWIEDVAPGEWHWRSPTQKAYYHPPLFVDALAGVAELMRELNVKARKDEQYWWWGQNAKRLVDAPRDAFICVRHGVALHTLFLIPWFWSPKGHPGDCIGDAWLAVFEKEESDG